MHMLEVWVSLHKIWSPAKLLENIWQSLLSPNNFQTFRCDFFLTWSLLPFCFHFNTGVPYDVQLINHKATPAPFQTLDPNSQCQWIPKNLRCSDSVPGRLMGNLISSQLCLYMNTLSCMSVILGRCGWCRRQWNEVTMWRAADHLEDGTHLWHIDMPHGCRFPRCARDRSVCLHKSFAFWKYLRTSCCFLPVSISTAFLSNSPVQISLHFSWYSSVSFCFSYMPQFFVCIRPYFGSLRIYSRLPSGVSRGLWRCRPTWDGCIRRLL